MNMMRRSCCTPGSAVMQTSGNASRSFIDELFGSPFFAVAPFRAMSEAETEFATLPVDISETEKDVIVRASLPGFKKEGISIEVHDGLLTITAELDEETEEKSPESARERFHRRERRMMSVNRSVSLPVAVDEGKAKAELKDGIMTLTLPKHDKVMPRKITVN